MNTTYKALKAIVCSPIYLSCLLILPLAPHAFSSEETVPAEVQYVPLAQYERMNLSSQSVESLTTGLVINSDNALFVGMVSTHSFEESIGSGIAKRYTAVDVLFDVTRGRHQYMAIAKSESDQLLNSAVENSLAAAVYGYELIQDSNISLVIGGGLALGDFGIETSNGSNWPLIPVPLVRLNTQSDWLETQFEFLTSPNFSFTLAPQGHVQVKGDFRMDQMRDLRDVIFETTLEYRPFSEGSEVGDFAGLAVGFKNDNYSAFMNNKNSGNDSAEVQYQALFAAIDLSLLKVTTGYAINGQTRFSDTENETLGEGFYFSIQGMFAF
jgi:hypothetical protein